MKKFLIIVNGQPVKFPVFKNDTAQLVKRELIEAQELDPLKQYALLHNNMEVESDTLVHTLTGTLQLVERKEELQTAE